MANFALGELLSPLDFEYLVRDLLSKDLAVELTAFAEGGDGGIDLRYSKILNDHHIVVQCKRQKSLSEEALLEERNKLEKLHLEKYYLAISSNCSVSKANLIVNLFAKWMENEAHIYDKARLNKLLDDHPDVLKHHYKLWINSSELFNSFINQSLIERSKSLFSNIKKEAKNFVKSSS